MSSGLGEADPNLQYACQSSHHRGPQTTEKHETRGSACDLYGFLPGMPVRIHGSQAPVYQSASSEHAEQQDASARPAVRERGK